MQKELVFIGLGRMGAAMTAHLLEEGFTVHAFDVDEAARDKIKELGGNTYDSVAAAIAGQEGRKIVWLMVPSKFVDDVLSEVAEELSEGDIIIDGGNSFFKDTLRRKEEMDKKQLYYIDCGTSGGMTGARHGAALMVGGDKEVVSEIEDIFITLAIKDGYARVGNTGAGHFVKMVHNGIEYGMMGAIAEGMSFIEDNSEEMGIDVIETLKPYQHGSIITSSLMDWMADSYKTEGYLESIVGEVPRGETEFEMEFIVEHDKTPVLGAALQQRVDTREKPSRIGTLVSAMRNQFGGHKTISSSKEGE